MKIEREKYLAFNIDDDTWDKIIESYAADWRTATADPNSLIWDNMTSEEAEDYRRMMMRQFQHNMGEYFYISKGAMGVIDRIKMTKFDLTQLAKLRRDTSTILIDQRHFYRYTCLQDQILVLFMELQPREDGMDYLQWTTFRIDTITGEHNDGGAAHVFDKFLRIMCFLELSSPELITLKDGQGVGTRKTGKVLNKSGFEVTLVRSDWNKIYVKNGFHVRGHWRWQHYGPNGEDLKLIFIEEFVKEGYTRTIKT